MKINNLLNFFIKTVFVCVVFITTAKTVSAQITLDLDVLSEDPSPKETTVSEPGTTVIPLKAPVETKKAVSPQKPKQPSSPVKPTVKKNAPKAKTAAKPVKEKKPAAEKEKEKYQIKETAQKDEHDKLKPTAAPVPKVKLLSAENSPEQLPPEETFSDKAEEPSKPKISKHFLEQQRLKDEDQKETVSDAVPAPEIKNDQPLPPPAPTTTVQKETPPREIKTETETKQPEEIVLKAEPKAPNTEKKPAILNFSVFPVSGKLTPKERSAVLSHEIPQESLTFGSLSEKKVLSHILIFEKKSYDLTDEMQNALNDIAVLMKKDRTKRLILYSYCSFDPDEPGKERQYALRRALMIRSYLTTQGINSLRIELRAQGSNGAGNIIPDRTDLVLQNK